MGEQGLQLRQPHPSGNTQCEVFSRDGSVVGAHREPGISSPVNHLFKNITRPITHVLQRGDRLQPMRAERSVTSFTKQVNIWNVMLRSLCQSVPGLWSGVLSSVLLVWIHDLPALTSEPEGDSPIQPRSVTTWTDCSLRGSCTLSFTACWL